MEPFNIKTIPFENLDSNCLSEERRKACKLFDKLIRNTGCLFKYRVISGTSTKYKIVTLSKTSTLISLLKHGGKYAG